MNAVTNTSGRIGGGITAAIWVETQKIRSSKILWISILGTLLLPLMSGLFMFILKNPELAHRLGLLGAKAQIMGGSADWPGFFNQILLMESVGGLVIFGFIFVWIFGREFVDRTFYDLLALPTSRTTIVTAKLFLGLFWSLALLVLVFLTVLGLGAILQLPGWSMSGAVNALEHLLITGALTVLLVIPFSWVACLTRGYLPAVGCIFLVLILAQVFNTLGYGPLFPWAVPTLYNNIAAEPTAVPGPLSYLLVIVLGLTSAIVTGLWWKHADQT